MDTATLVTRDIEEGQRALNHLAGEEIPVLAACLLKLQNRITPSLHIATSLVDQKGTTQAYRDVLGLLRSRGGDPFDALDISLVSEKHPLVHDVHSLHRRYGGGFLPSDISMFGGLAVDEVYVYPLVYPLFETFPGFKQIKHQFPSVELFTVNLTSGTTSPSEIFDPKQTSLLSKVNANEFGGKAPETLLFIGADGSPEKKLKRLAFAYRAEGWNTMFDGQAKRWRRVLVAETNRPLYEPADFSPLTELKSQPVAADA